MGALPCALSGGCGSGPEMLSWLLSAEAEGGRKVLVTPIVPFPTATIVRHSQINVGGHHLILEAPPPTLPRSPW